MSGTHLPFLSIGTDPLDDPLNLEWDAIVRNERPAAPEIDPDDFDLLRRMHAQANRALPEATFFGTLEQRLEELYGVPILKPERQPRLGREDVVPPSKSRARTLPIGPSSRWLPLASAMAVLLLLLIAGFAVLLRAAPGNSEPPAIPAASSHEPFIESVVQFAFEPGMLAVPGATTWTDMLVSIQKLDPGKPFTTNVGFYLGNDGPLIIMVLNGELELTPGGPAYLCRAGSDPKHPQRVEAGRTLTLGPQDAIVYSTQDGADGVNNGDTQMVAFVGQVSGPTGAALGIDGYDHGETDLYSFTYNGYPLPAPRSDSAVISVRRLRLLPFDMFVFDPAEDFIFQTTFDPATAAGLRIYDGVVSSFDLASGHASWKLQDLGPGPHTLINLGETPIDLYFLVLEPSPTPATPTP